MLLSLYRIELGTKKWYIHIVYYCIGVDITNYWSFYRRHCQQNGIRQRNIFEITRIPDQNCKFSSVSENN